MIERRCISSAMLGTASLLWGFAFAQTNENRAALTFTLHHG
jgi:hypothetical protein